MARLTTELSEFYHTNGFLGPVDLLTTDEAAEVRRHIEEVEAAGLSTTIRRRLVAVAAKAAPQFSPAPMIN